MPTALSLLVLAILFVAAIMIWRPHTGVGRGTGG